MRIQRPAYEISYYRRPRRSGGCLPFAIFLGALTGLLVVSWGWIGQLAQNQRFSGDLGGARRAFDAGDLDTAINAARQIFNAEPDRADALLLLVRALIYRSYNDWDRTHDRQLALQLATSALKNLPLSPDALAAHALALQAEGQSFDAYRSAQKALQIDPKHTMARVALALSYGGVGGFDNALQENLRINNPQEWEVDALRAQAISYSDLGRYQEAGQTIDKAIARNNRLLLLHFERALYALQLGDTGKATQSYFQVLALSPDNVKARLRLCEVSTMLREPEIALNYCTQVTQHAPSWSEGWHKLGREYFLQGNYAEARDALGKCASLQVMQAMPIPERSFECWYLQGQAAEILGDCKTLVATYNEFLSMAAKANLPQTWTYPPEGPPGCS